MLAPPPCVISPPSPPSAARARAVIKSRSPPVPFCTHSSVTRAVTHPRAPSPVSASHQPVANPSHRSSPRSACHARVTPLSCSRAYRLPPHAMSDANYSRSPAPRNSSLADLVHRHHSPPQHTQLRPSAATSDDGSQQERNHQRPTHVASAMQLLPPPGEVSRNAHNAHNAPPAVDSSPKHPSHRKRSVSQLVPSMLAPDISSLTHKPDDHASSVAQPPLRISPLHHHRRPDKFQRTTAPVEGSTNMLPAAASAMLNADNLSPSKSKHRLAAGDSRTELLEENRVLRIELEHVKGKLRAADSRIKKMHKSIVNHESLLQKYRSRLVDVFESGGDAALSLRTRDEREHKRDERSKMHGDSVSNSEEGEQWSAYSPSASFEPEQSEDIRRMHERDVMSRSERGGALAKHRRTRAPAWTAREEEIFMKAYHKHGCQWKLYQDSLPGRSRRQIQSHGSYLIRQGKLTKKNSRPWQRRKPRLGDAPASTVNDAQVHTETQEAAQRSDEE
eukprot:TRINITY_DN15_c1_g1_i1.p1 TRINITY_DN15_c1_g1~~TRINITY_DN15_c1_g1_i1.p1  ORF type:complete len:512 (+),score=104.07 TRINITY_DN15_c1_g1_i1:25-1536(+)